MPQPDCYIYALLDPRTLEVRYIGKSIRPRERLMNHCNEPGRSWRHHWLKQLKAHSLRPELAICETLAADDDWQAAERRWIAQAKAWGWRLTNCTSGGDGVPDLPPDARARISAAWIGRKHRAESLEKIGNASRGRKHTAEYRSHMRQVMSGREITWTAKVSRALSHLSDEQVKEIRALIAEGVPHVVIGPRYGVHPTTISNIRRRKSYSWV